MNTYPVHEMFYTFQGEGCYAGQAAFFVRLFGCPVHCNYCDSAGTWHPNYVPAKVPRLTPTDIVNEILLHRLEHVKSSSPMIVVLTGGEPAIHDLDALCNMLHMGGMRVHLETSGGFPLRGCCDWITVSPKQAAPLRSEVVEKASEFKFIIEAPADIDFYTRQLQQADPAGHFLKAPIWLHPEWSHREDREVLGAIGDVVKRNEFHYRAGWQLHKLYQVDVADPRSQPPVPLGGNPEKGY